MFWCMKCGAVSQPGEKCVKVIVKRRRREYYETRKDMQVLVGVGWEVAKELPMCPRCAPPKESVE